MNLFVLSIWIMLIHLTTNISHLIKLSFNTPKSTRGLDALSAHVLITQACEAMRAVVLNTDRVMRPSQSTSD
jgi:hypothetical protein